jgi:hypothetical protein
VTASTAKARRSNAMAALSRLDLGRNLRTRLGPEFFSTLLAGSAEAGGV